MKNKVNILGTEYTVEIHRINDDDFMKNHSLAGYCCSDIPIIVIADLEDLEHFNFHNEQAKDSYFKTTIRHEVIHAFLNESGLKDSTRFNGAWARNEAMVDFFAIQFPKIAKVYEELGVL